MKDIQIRQMHTGDEKIAAYITIEAWRESFVNILSKEKLYALTETQQVEENFEHALREGTCKGEIMLINHKPHCIALWDETREKDMPGYAELICFHSLGNNWGKGYGSRMMVHILEEIDKAGYHQVMLWVFEENTRARKFYEKHGFILSDKRKTFAGATEVMYYRKL